MLEPSAIFNLISDWSLSRIDFAEITEELNPGLIIDFSQIWGEGAMLSFDWAVSMSFHHLQLLFK